MKISQVRQLKDLERELEGEDKSVFDPTAVKGKIKMLHQVSLASLTGQSILWKV